MEGYSEDSTSSTKKEGEESPKKKATTFGLGKSTFEFVNKKDKAEKIAEAPLWERLIPKDGSPAPKLESSTVETESPIREKSEALPSNAKPEMADAEISEEASDRSLENLTESETAEVRKLAAQEESAQLKAERNEDEAPDLAAGREEAIKHLDSIAESAESTPLEPIESYAAVTAVGSEALNAAEAEPEMETVEMSEVAPDELEIPMEFDHEQEISLNTPDVTNETAAEAEEAAVEQRDDDTVPVGVPAASGQATHNQPGGPGSAGGNGNQPPNTPNRASASSSGPNNPNNSNGPAFANYGGGAPTAFNQNTAPTTHTVEYVRDRRSDGTYFLAGGILGYMLGRRRGRIKTEKRLRAVSKKLEKQISDVRQEVVQQAVVIREQARINYNLSKETQPAPRAIEAVSMRPETAQRKPETVAKSTPETKAAAEQVRTMDHREVLAMAEKVVIDGTSLRTIYESKQITEPGLRRITSEYLSGGDLRAALKREVQVKEMQYERDPQMRDRLAASYAGVDAAQPQASHEAMAILQAHGENKSSTKPPEEKSKAEAEAHGQKERAQQVLVATWIVFVVVLVIVAVILGSR